MLTHLLQISLLLRILLNAHIFITDFIIIAYFIIVDFIKCLHIYCKLFHSFILLFFLQYQEELQTHHEVSPKSQWNPDQNFQ